MEHIQLNSILQPWTTHTTIHMLPHLQPVNNSPINRVLLQLVMQKSWGKTDPRRHVALVQQRIMEAIWVFLQGLCLLGLQPPHLSW